MPLTSQSAIHTPSHISDDADADLTTLTELRLYGNNEMVFNDTFEALAAQLHSLRLDDLDNPEHKVSLNPVSSLPLSCRHNYISATS